MPNWCYNTLVVFGKEQEYIYSKSNFEKMLKLKGEVINVYFDGHDVWIKVIENGNNKR